MGAIRSTLVRAGVAVVAIGATMTLAGPGAAAAGTTKASVSLTGPSSAVYGSTVKFTGYAGRTGTTTPLSGATVYLQKAAHNTSGWVNVTSTKTTSSGTFAFSVQLNTPYDYRAYYGGSTVYTTAASPRYFPIVRQNVVFDSIKDTNWTLGTMQVGGRIYPTPAKGTRVWLQRYNTSTKTWGNYASTLTTGGNAFVIKGNFNGNVGTYRISAPQHGYYAYNYSRQVSFAHYKWRGAFTKPVIEVGSGPDADYYVYNASESPKRSEVEMRAKGDVRTTVVVNSAGCKSADLYAANFTNETDIPDASGRFGALIGATWVRGPWTLGPGGENGGTASLPNSSALTLRTEHTGTDDEYVYMYADVLLLCSN